MHYEYKIMLAIIAIFLISTTANITGMQVAPTRGEQQCFDSDGTDQYTHGNVQTNGRVQEDYCADANTLVEQTCNGPVTYRCQSGCRNGACIKLTFIKKPMPDISKGLQAARAAQQEQHRREQEQREAQEQQQREQQRRRQLCYDDCERQYNICRLACAVPLPTCDCDGRKSNCRRRC